MGYAIRGTLECEASIRFPTAEWKKEGSFYLLFIQWAGGLALAGPGADLSRDARAKRLAIRGEFWEERVSYRWSPAAAPGALDISASGELAFELAEARNLKNIEVQDGPIEKIVIGWAKDGDSPKQACEVIFASGYLCDVVVDKQFEGL